MAILVKFKYWFWLKKLFSYFINSFIGKIFAFMKMLTCIKYVTYNNYNNHNLPILLLNYSYLYLFVYIDSSKHFFFFLNVGTW